MNILDEVKLRNIKRLEEQKLTYIEARVIKLEQFGLEPLETEVVEEVGLYGKCPTCMMESTVSPFGVVKLGNKYYDYLEILEVLDSQLVNKDVTLLEVVQEVGLYRVFLSLKNLCQKFGYTKLVELMQTACDEHERLDSGPV